jgi:methenyltetrahydrofolate cyclohydrolase
MLKDQTLNEFLDQLASSSPTPGGGSVAALTGALGAGLVSMVANLTSGKEKYKDVQSLVETLLRESELLRGEMEDLIQKDVEAFNALSLVYKLPKNSEAEKDVRSGKLQEALKNASLVPLSIGIKALEVAKLAKKAAEIGNIAAVSDAGVAVVLARACTQSAALNVKININSIKDANFNVDTWEIMQDVLKEVNVLEKSVLEITYQKIG